MTVSPATAAVTLLASLAAPILFNLWLWRRDRRLAGQLAAQTRLPAPFGPDEATPRVSFLVAAWNEAGMIERCLRAVESLSYPQVELVLCAGGADGTLALAARHQDARLKLLEQQPGEGKQHALARCLEAASGSIIYLIDADCLISDETFRQCLAPILREGETVVTGSFYWPLPEQMDNPFVISQVVSRAYTAAAEPRYVGGLLGGNCVMRREALERAGGFANAVRTGTDYDLAKRLLETGQRIRYVSGAYIQSEFPTTVSAYCRQQARWIRNVVVHGLHYHAYAEVRACLRTSAVGLAMLAALPAALALALWRGPTDALSLALDLAWLALFAYALGARARYQRFTEIWLRRRTRQRVAWSMPAWVLLDYVAWALPMLEYPFQNLRGRW